MVGGALDGTSAELVPASRSWGQARVWALGTTLLVTVWGDLAAPLRADELTEA